MLIYLLWTEMKMATLSEAAKDIVHSYARVKPEDHVLIITDVHTGVIASVVAQQAKLITHVDDFGRQFRPTVQVAYLEYFDPKRAPEHPLQFPSTLEREIDSSSVCLYLARLTDSEFYDTVTALDRKTGVRVVAFDNLDLHSIESGSYRPFLNNS